MILLHQENDVMMREYDILKQTLQQEDYLINKIKKLKEDFKSEQNEKEELKKKLERVEEEYGSLKIENNCLALDQMEDGKHHRYELFNINEEYSKYKRRTNERYSRLRKYLKHRERESTEVVDNLNSELLKQNARIRELQYKFDYGKTRRIEVLQQQLCSLKKQLDTTMKKKGDMLPTTSGLDSPCSSR